MSLIPEKVVDAGHSEDLLVAGDYVFITARPPKVTTESIPLDPPHGFFKRLWWDWFGEKCIVKKTEEEVWPAYDVIIMVCPRCRYPLPPTVEVYRLALHLVLQVAAEHQRAFCAKLEEALGESE